MEIKTLIKLQVSKNSPQINSKTNEEETIKEIFTPPELRHEIINKLRLKEENDWWSKIENYWWSKISTIIWYNKGISKK